MKTTRSNDWKNTGKTKITDCSKMQIIPTSDDLNTECFQPQLERLLVDD